MIIFHPHCAVQISLHFAANIQVDSVSSLGTAKGDLYLGILTTLCQNMG